MKKYIVGFCLLSSLSIFAQSSKATKINELIQITGTTKAATDGIKQFIEVYKQNYKEIPNSFWDEFTKEAMNTDFAKMYSPVYDKYYTEEEIDALLKFYKSDIGKKMVAKSPEVMKESMDIGRVWGEGLAQKVIKKLEEEKGYKSPPPPMRAKSN